MSLPLDLNCIVFGDDPSHIFPVKIANTESVGALKDAIKEKKKPIFNHVPADALDIFRVSIPVDEELDAALQSFRLEHDPQNGVHHLSVPVKRLKGVFGGPIEEHIHVLVKRPPAVLPSQTNTDQEEVEREDIVTALTDRFERTITKILKAKSPSESAKSTEYQAYQHEFPIYDGRYDVKKPTRTISPPIQLFHPVFAHFLDDICDSGGALVVPDEVGRATVRYMHASSGIYDSEAHRRRNTGPLLREILGMGMSNVVNTDGTSSDGLVEVSLVGDWHESVAALLREDKRDFGDGGSDPSIQAGLSMARYWAQPEHKMVRNNTCCPTFLFANAGPWFVVLGAVFSDKVIVQRLTDYIWTGMDSSLNDVHCRRVARVMYALQKNVVRLRNYYTGLSLVTASPDELPPRFCPSVREYRDEDQSLVEFKYRRPLEDHPACVTFLAETVEERPKSVVVKFVQRYGEEAHRILAREGMSPKLFYYGGIGARDGDPSYGALRMVVMEYIEGTTLGEAKKLLQVPSSAKGQIKEALKHLHNNGLVFGDLRPPNIIITDNGDVKLVDFDWAGVHGESQYPFLLSSVLQWPDGVEGLAIMETRHDIDMLEQLFV